MNNNVGLVSIFLMLFFSISHDIAAQPTTSFEISSVDGKNAEAQSLFVDALRASDSTAFVQEINKKISDLWVDGYISTKLDTVLYTQQSVKASIFIGERYEFGDISIAESDLSLLEAAGLKNVRWKGKVLNQGRIASYTETLLEYLEDHGYPFAKVGLENTSFENGVVNGDFTVNKGEFIPFALMKVYGESDIRKSFLIRYLEIEEGEPFNRSSTERIQKRMADLPFLRLDSVPIIKFYNDKAEVQLFTAPKKASRFDFLIGVLPNTSATGERNFIITGDFTAEMHNRLGQGEYIFAQYQRLRPETQELDLKFKYPYLFDLPIGIDTKFELYRNTNEFLELILDAGILYQFNGESSLKASWNVKTSRLIDIDSTAILQSRKLPSKLDVSYTAGGLNYTYQSLDYIFNPAKGFTVNVGGKVGIKKVIRNNSIENLNREGLDFSTAYDTLKLNSFQTDWLVDAAVYIPTLKVATVRLGLRGGWQYNAAQIYENELYRIGGNRLLRGFDEQTIRTDAYAVANAEFRLFLDRNSYLSFPFIDYGITRVVIDDEQRWDTAIGIGMGINFSTPAGIFNVSFAAGRRLENPFDFGNTKIHFGYVSLF